MHRFEEEDLLRESSPDRVVVIGGGLAGLSAAHELRNRGIRPVVFEASDRLGGRSFGDPGGRLLPRFGRGLLLFVVRCRLSAL